MKLKLTILFLAIFTANSAIADEAIAIGDFFRKATQYAKARDYASFKTLYCSIPPKTLGRSSYFENKKRIFSDLKLTPRQTGLFDNLQYDLILYLCSRTKSTKEICMVQPVIKQKNRLCILNILPPRQP